MVIGGCYAPGMLGRMESHHAVIAALGMRVHPEGGWFVATNLNNVLKKTIIRLATEVAGLTFGKDVIVEI